jgi:hypothetical protein
MLEAGEIHWSPLLRRRCLGRSEDRDFTVVTFWTSGPGTVKRVARLAVREQMDRRTTAIQHREAKVIGARECFTMTIFKSVTRVDAPNSASYAPQARIAFSTNCS